MRAKPLALTLLPPLLAALYAAPAFGEETPQTATPRTAASPAAAPTAETEPSSPAPSPSPSTTPTPEASPTPAPETSPSTAVPEPSASPSETADDKATETAQEKDEAKDGCPEVPADPASVTREEAAAFYRAWAAEECAVSGSAAKAVKASGLTTYTEDVTLTAASLTQTGLAYDGVVTLPTSDGTKRLLKFSMKTAKLTGLRQTARGSTLTATEFAFSGDVVMYAASISGKAFGLLPMTLTPDAPPPLVLPLMTFTDVTVKGTAVTATTATVKGLKQG
ncbi:hypothetical protein [Actinocorallia sp. A-T 12471]|uniref:hypothetical protein n=1 Tax=Actinocorallia sp. A-T 12471 TaxID=3089813 RepID=UPI0029CFDFBE|nr:hypothetical protein [Actinocorallia sp. A-T 12471]MDX6743775.1 hypothetical protein [Actinocorallia sp. A-T 12471]